MKKKRLIIINGVTGAIGSACFTHFVTQKNTVVYGLSRKAIPFPEFWINAQYERKLPAATLICSLVGSEIGDTYYSRIIHFFLKSIPFELFDEIYYIHALGVYPFEIDKEGNRTVHNDNDTDGINDRCIEINHYSFRDMSSGLAKGLGKRVQSFIFGSISDKHEPRAHASAWKTMKDLKEYFSENMAEKKKNSFLRKWVVSLINMSSVLCPNEVINRPFVFSATDADPNYWLQPSEVVTFLESIMQLKQKEHFKEYELFKKKPDFPENYYDFEEFNERKIKELYRR